jgi:hypothetical protein
VADEKYRSAIDELALILAEAAVRQMLKVEPTT